MTLDPEAARAAMARLAEQLGMGLLETAQGIIDVVNAKMADAISTVTVRRGIDPRAFSLVAFGGAGPMHAVALAEELDIHEVIVPVLPGTFSAWGMLHTDFRRDLRRTLYRDLSEVAGDDLEDEYRQLEQEGAAFLSGEGLPVDAMSFERTVDLRYAGQEYALTVPIGPAPTAPGKPMDIPAVRQLFDHLYMDRYGHSNPAAPAELVKISVIATGQVPRPVAAAPLRESRGVWEHRRVLFRGEAHDCTIVPREQLAPHDEVSGGAIIEEATATTVVPPGWVARVLEGGHIVIRRLATRLQET